MAFYDKKRSTEKQSSQENHSMREKNVPQNKMVLPSFLKETEVG